MQQQVVDGIRKMVKGFLKENPVLRGILIGDNIVDSEFGRARDISAKIHIEGLQDAMVILSKEEIIEMLGTIIYDSIIPRMPII